MVIIIALDMSKDGHHRTRMIQCSNTPCSKQFKPRWPRQKFCSPSCGYASRSSPMVEIVCSNTKCGKTFKRRTSKTYNSKHGFQFCSRSCKDFAQSLKGDCKAIRPTHYGTGTGRRVYKNLIADMKRPRCCDCGEDRRYLLMVHHIDANRENNDRRNLEVVCSNCHVRRHLSVNTQGDWVYTTACLTPRERLQEI